MSNNKDVINTDEDLPDFHGTFAIRLAEEGVPIAAIARALRYTSAAVRDCLKAGREAGYLIDMPMEDWPVGQSREQRAPSIRIHDPQSLQFYAIQKFKLTTLMASMLLMILKRERAEKAVLHAVIEDCRNNRVAGMPDKELVDQKMVDVMICKLRARLKKVDPVIVIETAWGNGYYMTREMRTYVITLLTKGTESEIQKNPAVTTSPAGTPAGGALA